MSNMKYIEYSFALLAMIVIASSQCNGPYGGDKDEPVP